MDQYGGWTGRQFEATGFFRTEHDGQRWWLVTPEGNAFLSLGINHYHAGWWNQNENRDHWVKEWGANQPFDAKWNKGFRDEAQKDCKHLGLNTLGYHCETPQLLDAPNGPFMPYIRQFLPIRFSLHLRVGPEGYPDVFDPAFAQHCDTVARQQVKPHADDPLLLGWAMADVPVMMDSESSWSGVPTWPRVLRNLGPDAPGKQAYVATMQERHSSIGAFNSAYKTSFASWDDLLAERNWRIDTDLSDAVEKTDNIAFLRKCVREYYRQAKEALRRYDANHLFLGDKMNGNGDPLDHLADVVSEYVDVMLIQIYGPWNYQKNAYDRWSPMLNGKPIINGDSTYRAVTEMMPNPGITIVSSQKERGERIIEFCEGAFARSDFVGWHICTIMDQWKTMPGFQQRQKGGLKTPTGEFYPETERVISELSDRLYQIGSGETVSDEGPSDQIEVSRTPIEAWRTLAYERIEAIRKSDLTVEVTDAEGAVVEGAQVRMELKRHKFLWGAVVNEYWPTSPHLDIYKEIFPKYFNASGSRLSLKPKQRGTINEQRAEEAWPWFVENDIYMRGHMLVWEHTNWWDNEMSAVYNDSNLSNQKKGERLIELSEAHFHHAIPKWDVECWDVMNEPLTNHMINDLVPMNTFTHWFKLADELRLACGRPDVQLYINEFQIISGIANWALPRPAKYRQVIDQMLAEGAPIEGIGFQGRFKADGPLAPEIVYERLGDFEKYGLPYHITEFEIRDSPKYQWRNEEKRRVVNEMMTIYFSHPNVEGFWHWTFCNTPNGNEPFALFKYDGTPYPCGPEGMGTMDEDFDTDVTLVTDTHGECSVRGFKGEYEITVSKGPLSKTVTVTLDDDRSVTLEL